ncbi:ABC transporter substrate-binding protein [Glutamicibacter sp. MNS18]|uniref:ABC transporter substrate-binding protein n=1 Tax=Glutamicibacter sp. MNS18 TaxID=2989817 RepID=UPI0022359017|nr:ABC transporter substrate-binding protein [Glutamicibacter sp. MNS18]MCW4465803.1 ABC transporter substrate-binding protein [Glutamicibacter sp. MNS18]
MTKRLSTILAGASILALTLVGCGSGSPSGSTETDSGNAANGELTKVVLGILPIAPSAAVQYGINEGIFEKHGLDIELNTSNAGAAMLPAVSTGELNIAVGNPLSVITAVDRGLDMKIVTGYSASKAEGEDANAVIVKADSGIDSWADLVGKTTAINALRTQGDLTIMESTELDGANPADLKFSEMPFPDMQAQLDRGNIDAMWVPEPFMSRALADDSTKLLGYPNQEAIPGMPTMVTFTSAKFAEENAEIIEDFQAAMQEILPITQNDPDLVRALLPDFINMDAEESKTLVMESWNAEVPTSELEQLAALAEKFEFIGSAPDISAMSLK